MLTYTGSSTLCYVITFPLYKLVTCDRTSLSAKGKYELHYPPNGIVCTIPGTLGIFLYTTLKSVTMMQKHAPDTTMIIQVKALTPCLYPKAIGRHTTEDGLDRFYNSPAGSPDHYTYHSPIICCDKVRVLD